MIRRLAARPAPRPLRVLFAVQGEGRGHMTQALAVAGWLRARGHTVTRVLVGRSARRRPPRFVLDELRAPVSLLPSPNFAADRDGTVLLGRTILDGARGARRYATGLRLVDRIVQRERPDVIVNFYEGLVGLWARLHRPAVPVVAVAHQFMFEHPAYPFAPGQALQRLAVRRYTTLVGSGATLRLALSFYDAPPAADPRHRVVPPLLRPQLRALGGTHDDGSLLVYLVEPALAEAVVAWSGRRPEVPLHCFWDGPAYARAPSLRFHALDGEHFLRRMAQARGVVCTAGFESVSEALWLGKPALMVPTPGHYEQRCNARDAEAAGAGVAAETFDLDALLGYLPHHRASAAFRRWADAAERLVVEAIEETAGVAQARQAA